MSLEAAIAALAAIVVLLSVPGIYRIAFRGVQRFMATLELLVEHRTGANTSDSDAPPRGT